MRQQHSYLYLGALVTVPDLSRSMTASRKVISMSLSVLRMGKWVAADEVFEAWGSGDLTRMLAALTLSTNPIDRHFLLLGIVRATYKQRTNPEMRDRKSVV